MESVYYSDGDVYSSDEEEKETTSVRATNELDGLYKLVTKFEVPKLVTEFEMPEVNTLADRLHRRFFVERSFVEQLLEDEFLRDTLIA
jgi:hypothetical protein